MSARPRVVLLNVLADPGSRRIEPTWRWIWRVSASIGMMAGLAMCALAWQHNPQAAIHDGDGRVDWVYLLQIWLGWFLLSGAASAIVNLGLIQAFLLMLPSRRPRRGFMGTTE